MSITEDEFTSQWTVLQGKFAALAKIDYQTRYDQGDLLNQYGPTHGELTELARLYVYTVSILLDRQRAAETFPKGHRVRELPHGIGVKLLRLDTPEDREKVLNERPLHEWTVNTVERAVRDYLRAHDGTTCGDRRSRLESVLVVPGP